MSLGLMTTASVQIRGSVIRIGRIPFDASSRSSASSTAPWIEHMLRSGPQCLRCGKGNLPVNHHRRDQQRYCHGKLEKTQAHPDTTGRPASTRLQYDTWHALAALCLESLNAFLDRNIAFDFLHHPLLTVVFEPGRSARWCQD
jgi:hypothetical protein